jgi:uncharacterized damage-inducible protein DinB
MASGRSKRPATLIGVTPEECTQRLEAGVQRLLQDIDRLPADVLYREPHEGEWPVMSTLAHVSELLPYWAHQAERIASSPGIAFGRTHDDPQRIGAIEQHGQDSVETIVPRIRASLAECVATLRSLPPEAWSRQGQHPSRGTMTVDQVVNSFLLNHIEEHAAQISATLSTLSSSPPVR